MIRVLVADDQAMVRAGLRLILEGQSDIEVVGEAVDGEDAQVAVRRDRPDLVLMDIRMPDLSGNEALKLLREDSRTAELPIVALTSSTMRGDEKRFLTQGFDGYLPCAWSPNDIDANQYSLGLTTCLTEGGLDLNVYGARFDP